MLPLFYYKEVIGGNESLILDEDNSKHIVQVLRMKNGELIHLTDGKGNLMTSEIIDDHKKKVMVKIQDISHHIQAGTRITIAISLLKNANRFEWFLEKSTEIGISEIIPVICERTERQHFRHERMQNILVSAMLQSKQYWLPILTEPISLAQVAEASNHQQKLIAHCLETDKKSIPEVLDRTTSTQIILIGPEGDFTTEETTLAMKNGFLPVTLGKNRLRAETAGVVAGVLMKLNC